MAENRRQRRGWGRHYDTKTAREQSKLVLCQRWDLERTTVTTLQTSLAWLQTPTFQKE